MADDWLSAHFSGYLVLQPSAAARRQHSGSVRFSASWTPFESARHCSQACVVPGCQGLSNPGDGLLSIKVED
ncbi:uncharacterized protein CCOS01_06758 [Colletotrichum costaricense]|uniref:Uncharacterized protein n=1 Tax=Colletotrichum costaricense TaxID=1209916 RepID=A0AAI9YYQ6_9PEZI|nr:uncharacterized protein CCOS01_06758 [Colletotrichum costaricense]KAK1528924.1 hypothetical protein CCOS01_06758 [Colletotrichum costaricense]